MTTYPVKKPVIPGICRQQGCGTLTALKALQGGHGRAYTYRTLATMKALFNDRYALKPNGRVPQVTRRYQGKTWYLQKGKSPCAAPPEGTPPNQKGGSLHGYGIAVDVNVSNAQFLRWLRLNAPTYGFYWQGQPTLPDGRKNPEWEAWHLNWCNGVA